MIGATTSALLLEGCTSAVAPTATAKPASSTTAPATTGPAQPAAQPTAAPAVKPTAATGSDRITVGMSSPLLNTDSADHLDLGGRMEARQVYDALTEIGKDEKLSPLLAESWQALDDKTWEFRLRKGVKFHNGEPFTAESVKFTLDRLLPPSKLVLAPTFAMLEGTEVRDEYTVVVHTKQPYGSLPNMLTLIGMYPPKAGQDSKFFEKPIGTGPYRMVDWTRGERWNMVANPDYWKKGVAIVPNVTYRYIGETSTRMAALRAGEVDIVDRVPPDQIPTLKGTPGVSVVSKQAVEVQQWFFNNAKKPFDDVRVRRAVSLAIDREAIIRDMWMGNAVPCTGPIPPGVFGHVSMPLKKYDPVEAKRLLQQAGVPDGFAFDFMIFKGVYAYGLEIAQAVAAMLNQVGLKANVLNLEVAAAREARGAGNFGLFYSAWAFAERDPDQYMYQWFTKAGSASTGRYSDSRVEEALPRTRLSDPQIRQKAYEDVQKILWEDEPTLWPFYSVAVYAIRDRVVDFNPAADYIPLVLGVSLK
ncbi:MAG: ABC transporter substrate-binding protein [Chloroflexota bacterium]